MINLVTDFSGAALLIKHIAVQVKIILEEEDTDDRKDRNKIVNNNEYWQEIQNKEDTTLLQQGDGDTHTISRGLTMNSMEFHHQIGYYIVKAVPMTSCYQSRVVLSPRSDCH